MFSDHNESMLIIMTKIYREKPTYNLKLMNITQKLQLNENVVRN